MLIVKDLNFSYGEGFKLKIPFLEVKKGESVFLYGPSGTGKSTFLSLISGVLNPDSGSITFNEIEFEKAKSSQKDKIRGEKIGYIFQSLNLINYLTVQENILLPLKIHPKRGEGLNSQEELIHLSKRLGIESLLRMKPSQLSVGQQQRVAAARALIGRPELIIADEPTSALDKKNAESFLSLLLDLSKEREFSILFVSHDLSLKDYFNNSVSLEELQGALV